MQRNSPSRIDIRGRRHRQRAIATVEFALVAPLLMLLWAGVLDFSMLLRTSTCAASAARAGAEYGSSSTASSSDYSGMQNAALNAAPGVTGMTASATRSCSCSGGSAVSCSGSCGSGKMLMYVRVTTHATANTLFHYSALNFSGMAASQATVRVQ
jgi:Flp pilus assembly protein TadG